MLEGIRDARAMLKEARSLVERVKDQPRRARLEQAAQQIDVPLTEATQAGHAFVYDDLEERLGTARRRLAALLEELANPVRAQ
jgi:ABC-type phosphate transport system auxiliary subunit